MPLPNIALRNARKRSDLTIAELATRAGVSSAAISRIESGARWGHPRTLQALADALGVKAEDLGGISRAEGAA